MVLLDEGLVRGFAQAEVGFPLAASSPYSAARFPPAAWYSHPRTAAVALATGTAVTVASALRPARLAALVAPIRALREALPTAVRRSRARLVAGITGIAAAAPRLPPIGAPRR